MKPGSIDYINALPELGVGITYSSELEPILKKGLIDIIEIEPQTLWLHQSGTYSIPSDVTEHLKDFPLHKLIHSVGLPVGGTFRGTKNQIDLLVDNIIQFKSAWASEHLGFNATSEFHTGFFLPPLQTWESIEHVVKSINTLKDQLPVPFAIETGVNYLKPREGEMDDGDFINQVIENSGCGLLLDLHNLFANQLNGRQKIEKFLSQIDLSSVWEIHIAGGLEMDGFWLDAHSGKMPQQLIDISLEVVQHLPNLKAIIYELLPSYIPIVGLDNIEKELMIVRRIWENRKRSSITTQAPQKKRPVANRNLLGESISNWEESLGKLAIGKSLELDTFKLSKEPGIVIIQKLIQEFRASMLVTVFKLSSRLIMLGLGPDVFKIILRDFWDKYPPQQFASEEALHFAEYMKELNLQLPNLKEILEFEEAILQTLIDNKNRIVTFYHDPFPLLRSLSEGKLGEMNRQEGIYEIEITGGEANDQMWKSMTQNTARFH